MSKRRGRGAEEGDDGSSKFEWGGGLKGEIKKEELVKKEGKAEAKRPEDDEANQDTKKKPKMKFETSGLLREEAVKSAAGGLACKYVASEDSAMPKGRWALYPFKNGEALDAIALHRQEWYLMGKDREIVHIPIDHLTCSREHAVIQWRRKTRRNEFGDELVSVVPYLMDLDSSNGTFLNKKRIESMRYYELRHQDMLTFASSTREYILLNQDKVK